MRTGNCLFKIGLTLAILVIIGINPITQAAFKMTSESDCTPIRIDLPPSPLAKIKRHDMDGLVMCTAYSSTFCADAERVLENPNTIHFTSPLYVGMQYAKFRNQSSLIIRDGLMMPTAINKLQSCSYEVVSDSFLNQKNGPFLSRLNKDYESRSTTGILQCLNNSGIKSVQNLKDIGSYFQTNNFVDFSNKLFGDLCAGNSENLNSLPKMTLDDAAKYGTNRDKALNTFRDTFNKNLKRGRPTGINYCELVLKNPNIRGITSNGKFNPATCKIGDKPVDEDDVAGHSSNIVGRRPLRFKDGNTTKVVCQYLVRDVYGSSCSKYPPDKTADPSETCENGSIWVDEDAILDNTASIFHY